MASDAQKAANRANAQRSTGPKTQIGKKKSSRNALRHGLSAKSLVVMKETIEDYEDFRAAMRRALLPQDAVEEQLFERVVLCAWRLRRISRVEAAIITESALDWRRRNFGDRLRLDEGTIFRDVNSLHFARLEAALDRSFERALALLEHRQQARFDAALNDAAGEGGDDPFSRLAWETLEPNEPSEPSPHLSDYPEELAARMRLAVRGDDPDDDV
ncbi:MAG TPA: hypothetical protein VLX09_24390 [Stellaceae bacterium]|nr:hypothetical protein [Stellaceae bacterium]